MDWKYARDAPDAKKELYAVIDAPSRYTYSNDINRDRYFKLNELSTWDIWLL